MTRRKKIEIIISFFLSGGAQPKVNINKALYTNCIVTFVLSNGDNFSMLFTSNPAFDRNSKSRRNVAHLDAVLADLGIPACRVVFMASIGNKKTYYLRESTAMLDIIFKMMGPHLRNVKVIFSDNGSPFMLEGANFIEDLPNMDAKHVFFPAPVHQYLSVNDNKLHGVGKRKWRALLVDRSDDVHSSILLLKCLDDVSADLIKAWFKTNGRTLNKENIRNLTGGPNPEKQEYFYECLLSYRKFMRRKSDVVDVSVTELYGELDGVYWS